MNPKEFVAKVLGISNLLRMPKLVVLTKRELTDVESKYLQRMFVAINLPVQDWELKLCDQEEFLSTQRALKDQPGPYLVSFADLLPFAGEPETLDRVDFSLLPELRDLDKSPEKKRLAWEELKLIKQRLRLL